MTLLVGQPETYKDKDILETFSTLMLKSLSIDVNNPPSIYGDTLPDPLMSAISSFFSVYDSINREIAGSALNVLTGKVSPTNTVNPVIYDSSNNPRPDMVIATTLLNALRPYYFYRMTQKPGSLKDIVKQQLGIDIPDGVFPDLDGIFKTYMAVDTLLDTVKLNPIAFAANLLFQLWSYDQMRGKIREADREFIRDAPMMTAVYEFQSLTYATLLKRPPEFVSSMLGVDSPFRGFINTLKSYVLLTAQSIITNINNSGFAIIKNVDKFYSGLGVGTDGGWDLFHMDFNVLTQSYGQLKICLNETQFKQDIENILDGIYTSLYEIIRSSSLDSDLARKALEGKLPLMLPTKNNTCGQKFNCLNLNQMATLMFAPEFDCQSALSQQHIQVEVGPEIADAKLGDKSLFHRVNATKPPLSTLSRQYGVVLREPTEGSLLRASFLAIEAITTSLQRNLYLGECNIPANKLFDEQGQIRLNFSVIPVAFEKFRKLLDNFIANPIFAAQSIPDIIKLAQTTLASNTSGNELKREIKYNTELLGYNVHRFIILFLRAFGIDKFIAIQQVPEFKKQLMEWLADQAPYYPTTIGSLSTLFRCSPIPLITPSILVAVKDALNEMDPIKTLELQNEKPSTILPVLGVGLIIFGGIYLIVNSFKMIK